MTGGSSLREQKLTRKKPNALGIREVGTPIGWRDLVCQSFLPTALAVTVALLPLACRGRNSDGSSACQSGPGLICAEPTAYTASVPGDADDCAIWIHPVDPSLSLILGTDKASGDGLHVWSLQGEALQRLAVARPNNVDVRQEVLVDGVMQDLVVVSLRRGGGLRVFRVDPLSRLLSDVTAPGGLSTTEVEDPYGVCLHHRRDDGALFAFVTSRSGASARGVHQYALRGNGAGLVEGLFVRTVGASTIKSLVEGLVADDAAGHLYAAEENVAIHKLVADPVLALDEPIAAFAIEDDIRGDREGLALYACSDGTGYVILSSQGNSTLKLYPLQGADGNPDFHPLLLTVKTPGATSSDGVEATSLDLGPGFPQGLVLKHHSRGRSFALFPWASISGGLLDSCPPAVGPAGGNGRARATSTARPAALIGRVAVLDPSHAQQRSYERQPSDGVPGGSSPQACGGAPGGSGEAPPEKRKVRR